MGVRKCNSASEPKGHRDSQLVIVNYCFFPKNWQHYETVVNLMWGEDLNGCILFYISQDHKINQSAMNEWMNGKFIQA